MNNTPPRAFVLGTAGHVDHGKTTLVRCLTGIETDRLPEERRRGISIELGFAWLDLDPSTRLAIVDVPGHERFIRHMIGGAAGIDAVMLVIAADEGVMPQTREHLAICSLLGVKAGLIVLTRTDLVEPDFISLVREDVITLVSGTFLEGQPIVEFSSISNSPANLDPLRAVLSQLVGATRPDRSADRPFVLPIDRCFTLHGHGTVVTGTSISGAVSVGSELFLSPGHRSVRIRGVEAHGSPTHLAGPGRRLALNLSQIAVHDIPRGARLIESSLVEDALMWDATLSALPHLPFRLEDGEKALLYVGTSRVETTIALLDADFLAPGASMRVQLRFDSPLAILPGEHFVIRGFRDLGALGGTLGGGVIFGPSLRRRRRPVQTWPWHAPPAEMLELRLYEAGEAGLDSTELPGHLPLPRTEIEQALRQGLAQGTVLKAGSQVVSLRALTHLNEAIEATLRSYHDTYPARAGMKVEELRTRTRPDGLEAVFSLAVAALERSSRIHHAQGDVRLASHREAVMRADIRRRLVEIFEQAELAPPLLDALYSSLDAPRAIIDEETRALTVEGLLIRVSKELLVHRTPLQNFTQKIAAYFDANETLDAQALKEITGVSRKFSIPLGEWLDKVKLTVRIGDVRRRRTVR